MTQDLHSSSLAPDLLQMKLQPLRPRSHAIPRPPLFTRLEDGIHKKMALVSAPAGFGKTTLVGQRLAHHRQQDAETAAAWVSLDRGDNDPVRFWRYVLTACHAAFSTEETAVGKTALEMVQGAPPPSLERMLTTFINDLTRLSQPALLILDDQAHKLPGQVSGGQQQRAAVARALANDPPLVVADEPTGNLDSRTGERVFHLFNDLVAGGKTVVMVMHNSAHVPRTTLLREQNRVGRSNSVWVQLKQASPAAEQDTARELRQLFEENGIGVQPGGILADQDTSSEIVDVFNTQFRSITALLAVMAGLSASWAASRPAACSP